MTEALIHDFCFRRFLHPRCREPRAFSTTAEPGRFERPSQSNGAPNLHPASAIRPESRTIQIYTGAHPSMSWPHLMLSSSQAVRSHVPATRI